MFTHSLGDDARLKLLGLSDASALFDLTDRNREYLRKWLPWVDSTKALADSENFIRSAMSQFGSGDGFRAGIWQKDDLVGVIGYHPRHRSSRSAFLGYWLGESFQGKGLVTRACRAIAEHAFRDLGVNRLEVAAATENTKSRAVPERLGFKLEGLLREREWLNGRFVDHAIYAMLASEWPVSE